jgi:hypothetical protein
MVISRDVKKDGTARALMLLKTDSPAPNALLEKLRSRPNIVRVKALVLPDRSA